jgi:hypothetical protein
MMLEEEAERRDGARRGRSVKCGGYRIIRPECILRCSSVVVREGAFVRDCRRIGWGYCGGSRGIRVKVRGRRKGEDKEKKRAEKNSWERERKVEQKRAKQIDIWIEWKKEVTKRKENEESKNRDKKIIVITIKMVMLKVLDFFL